MKISSKKIEFKGELWLYSGKAAWHFVTLSKGLSKQVASFMRGDSSAWGSIKVVVQVKDYKWETSIFPDSKIGAFLLPIKKQVRKDLNIAAGHKLRGILHLRREAGLLMV